MKINDIREARALAVAEMRQMLDTAGDKKLNPEQQKRFDEMKAQVSDLEEQESRAAFLENAERRMIAPATETRDRANLEQRVSVAKILQAQVEGRALSGAEAEYAKEAERRTGRKATGVFVPLSAFETRAGENDTTTAANLVPVNHRADQYVGALRNQLMARRLGVRVLAGLSGNVSIPKHGASQSVGWVGEGGNLTATEMGFDEVTLAPKHAGGFTEMSRQLIQQSSPDIEQLIRDDMSFLIAQAIDGVLIKGGGANEPTGILASIGSNGGVQSESLATLSWANVLKMVEAAEMENAGVNSWLTSPQVKTKLASTLKASGIAGYLLENGQMAEMPLYSTNQVPLNTTTGQLILGDWSQVLLGVWSEIDILVNPYDSTAYKRGGVLVRAMTTCDVAIRHPEAFVVADDITV